MAYVFSRDTSAVAPNYTQLAQSGTTVALASSDPNLAAQVAAARAAGAPVAIWIPHHDENSDPVAYAKQMAAFAQYYKPDAILPNVEAQPDGDPQGWNQKMMDAYAQLVPPTTGPRVDVVTEPKAGYAFNYKPYINYGGGAVVEAFRGDMSPVDAAQLRAQLINDGIPEDRINMLFGPNDPQSRQYGGPQSLYTIDDAHGGSLEDWLGYGPKANTTSGTRGLQGSTGDNQPATQPHNQLPNIAKLSNYDPWAATPKSPWNLSGIIMAARDRANTAMGPHPALSTQAGINAGVGQFLQPQQPTAGQPQAPPPDLQSIAQAAQAVIHQRPDLAGSALAPVQGAQGFGNAQLYQTVPPG